MLAFLAGFAVGAFAGLLIAIASHRRRQAFEASLRDIPDFLLNPVPPRADNGERISADLDWIEIHPLPKRFVGKLPAKEGEGASSGALR